MREITLPDGTTAVIWDERFPSQIGEYRGYEYRESERDLLICVYPIVRGNLSDGRPGAISLCFVPSDMPDGRNPVFDALIGLVKMTGLLVEYWSCKRDAAGHMLIPDLEVGESVEAASVRGAWPKAEGWHVRLPTDDPDKLATGPCCFGILLSA
jgi:hypothetical protein